MGSPSGSESLVIGPPLIHVPGILAGKLPGPAWCENPWLSKNSIFIKTGKFGG
jgi:hypothetical protein